jgi:hypothetical protein
VSYAPIQERDRVAGRALTAIALTGIVITIASILVAWLVMNAASPHPEEQASAAPPPASLGTVEHSLFDKTARGLELRASQRQELDELGWSDRDAGLVHVPIDRAIDLYVGGAARTWPERGRAREEGSRP